MKLNADIIFERLSKEYPVEMYGQPGEKLLLMQPELYIDKVLRFYENHVYIATVEHLPRRPFIEKNVLLICIGNGPSLAYYKERASVILIRKHVEFYGVYQAVQEIFALFSDWESRVLKLFMEEPSVPGLLQCSYPVFGHPMMVLDSAYNFVASVPENIASFREDSSARLEPEAFLEFLQEKNLNLDVHGALYLDMSGENYLCVNLFDAAGDYTGCFCIDMEDQQYRKGVSSLAEYLAEMLVRCFAVNPSMSNHDKRSLKNILQLTMYERPLSRDQKLLLRTNRSNGPYYCMSVHYINPTERIPVSYICSIFEGIFADSVFFEYNNTLLGLLPSLTISNEDVPDYLMDRLKSVIEEMQLFIGISNEFNDLYMLQTFYRQAEAAIENARFSGQEYGICRFEDHILLEMITNLLGDLPVEVYFPKGFRELMLHDNAGGISYIETLKVFLDENMSYAKAARKLFIHRSTLIERIERIEKELSVDLEDPDQRLRLLLILKALEVERQLRERP